MRKLDVCITTFERLECTLDSYDKIYFDERVENIIVVDDCSDIELYNRLADIIEFYPKVKLTRNEVNLGCYYNKKRSVELATNDYVILLDSDNVIGLDYLDRVYEQEWDEKTVFAPVKALPVFDYSNFSDVVFTKENAHSYVDEKGFDCVINTANYFFNKYFYLQCFETGIEPIGSDTMHHNYNMIVNGGKIKVLPNLIYQHRVWEQSHFVNNAAASMPLCQQVISKFRALR